ncbi:MAG TPA: OsmC family protein, partial [Virgibacillus sp.]|nr:OsmC family protein [Virgibacillus sp.]
MNFTFNENNVTTDLDYGQLTISGNEDYGFRPFQLMVSAIASCSGSVFKRVLEKQRVEIESLSVNASVHRNEKEANRLE